MIIWILNLAGKRKQIMGPSAWPSELISNRIDHHPPLISRINILGPHQHCHHYHQSLITFHRPHQPIPSYLPYTQLSDRSSPSNSSTISLPEITPLVPFPHRLPTSCLARAAHQTPTPTPTCPLPQLAGSLSLTQLGSTLKAVPPMSRRIPSSVRPRQEASSRQTNDSSRALLKVGHSLSLRAKSDNSS